MSDQQNENSGKTEKVSRTYDAYAVRNDADGKGHFHKIGAAFAHKDGQGHDIDLVAAPTNGRITLRTPKDRLDQLRREEEAERSEDEREHWANKSKTRSKSKRSRRRDQDRGHG